MENSHKTENPTTEGDLRPPLNWDHSSGKEASQNEKQINRIDEIEDDVFENDDGNLSQHEPLLSPASDKLHALSPRKTVQFGPFKKSKSSTDDNQDRGVQTDVTDYLPEQTNHISQNDSHRNQKSSHEHGAPQLVSSAEPRVSFYSDNIQVDITNGRESGVGSKSRTISTGLDAHENKRLIKQAPLYPRYNDHRRRKTWDAISHRMKKSHAKALKDSNLDLVNHRDWKSLNTVAPESQPQNELTKTELLKSYRLHIFVSFIFIVIVLSVSLSWYFKKEAQEKLYSSQAIFYNPRSRELTLSDTSKSEMIKGHLGLDIPKWMLPLHCPIVMGDNPHYKECLWKRVAILRITHFQDLEIQCYNISWESLGPTHVPHDCFYISGAKWYGPSNQSVVSFPLQGQFDYNPINVALINNGLFDTVVDFYWLSSHGTAIYVDADNPIQMSWNISGSDQLCLRSNFSGPLYHKTNIVQHPVMNYTICQGTDPRKTHLHMQKMFAPSGLVQHPPDSVLTSAHWSVKSIAKTDNVNQSHVTDLLGNISHYGFEGNAITLDGNWQKYYGDLVFDEERFSNVTEMMTTLNNSGGVLTLEVSPYFLYRSQNFHTGVESNMFVKDAGGEVTGLTSYRGSLAAVLDVFSESGREWYRTKLQNLGNEHQIKSYRLSYGQKSWLPYKPHFDNLDATPNMYRKHISDLFGKLPGVSLVMEHTSDSRHVASLIPVVTGLSEDKKCLTDLIETALTLGFMGYPYVMADGIKLEPDENDPQANYKPSRELYIRWLQLVSLFPAYQYSIAPWEYDQEIISIAKNVSVQRNSRVMKAIKSRELQLEVGHGYPILRPIWWMNGENHSVHDLGIKDEFLIGNYLLAAPILCEGTTERNVYVPSGVWENMDTKAIVLGPTTIRILNVTLDSVIMFQRRSVTGEMRSKPDF